MSQRILSKAIVFALGAACSMTAVAQVKPDVLVKQRQAAMALQGKYFTPLRLMAQGKMPYDGAVVTRNVAFMDALSKMPWDGFTPASKEIKSGATPAVYSEPAKFKEAADRFQSEVTRLTEVTRKGDEAAIKAQILAVNKSCGGCHDNFRERQ